MKKIKKLFVFAIILSAIAIAVPVMAATATVEDKTMTYSLTTSSAPSATGKTVYPMRTDYSATRTVSVTIKYTLDGKTYSTNSSSDQAYSTVYGSGSSTASITVSAPNSNYTLSSANSTHTVSCNGTKKTTYLAK